MLFQLLQLFIKWIIYVTYYSSRVKILADIPQSQNLKRRRPNAIHIQNCKINSISHNHYPQWAVLFLPCCRRAKIDATSTTGYQDLWTSPKFNGMEKVWFLNLPLHSSLLFASGQANYFDADPQVSLSILLLQFSLLNNTKSHFKKNLENGWATVPPDPGAQLQTQQVLFRCWTEVLEEFRSNLGWVGWLPVEIQFVYCR